MINVNDLEIRWRKYKIKSYIPHIVILISLSIIILIFTIKYYDVFGNNIIEKNNITKPRVIKEEVRIKKEINEVKKSFHNNEKLVLSPSLNFISNIQHSSISYYDNYELHANDIKKKTKKKKEQKKEKKAPIKVKKIEKKVEKKIIHINRQNTKKDIGHVIKRFKKNNNPALSLFVAKKYYELKDYNMSYNYALITNEINDNIDASWIIFAKSLVKMNKKEEAVKTLQRYIQHSNSNQAKILLDEIQSGKFK
jgi:hypothetical protein